MKFIMLGLPGAGKGTQAEGLAAHFQIPKISTGDMLRCEVQKDTPLGRQAKSIIDSGELVSDALMLSLVQARTTVEDCDDGFLLDGFPRTLAQAEGLRDTGIEIDCVVHIDVSPAEIIRRLSGRRMHAPSGRIYHIVTHPPKEKDKDDITGEPLIQRDDDKESTIRNRLFVYQKNTNPLVDYYKKLHIKRLVQYVRINGIGPVSDIQSQLLAVITKKSK